LERDVSELGGGAREGAGGSGGTFRQSMAWLHTWSGLLLGWVLFFIFLTGTAGYFDTEIDRWMRPELPPRGAEISAAEATALALNRFEHVAPDAMRWIIYPPSGRDIPELNVFWQNPPGHPGPATGSEVLSGESGEPLIARDTGGGQTLYQMHYRLHYLPARLAYWIVGVCTMFMLIALLSGVITHKRIFRDFFSFRPGKGQRSWLDAHNVLAVTALPFHLMITYSGLVFFAFTYMPLVVGMSYGFGDDGRQQFFDEAFGRLGPPPAGVSAPLAPLDAMIEEAERRWGPGQIRFIDIGHPGDVNATVTFVRGHVTPTSNGEELMFAGISGTPRDADSRRSGAQLMNHTLQNLHEGLFAGPFLRWLYFLSGLAGTAMIATGLILWTAKRAHSQQEGRAGRLGIELVQRLNIGTIVGLPIGIAAYFWANRLIPADLAGRADWEVNVLFMVWAAMLAHAALRPIRRAWLEQLWAAALIFALVPVVNALTTERHLGTTLASGEWALAGVDLVMLGFASTFALAACVWQASRASRPQSAARRLSARHSSERAAAEAMR
jgi:uncharacterized membrane protein YuzA (DUF378 family)